LSKVPSVYSGLTTRTLQNKFKTVKIQHGIASSQAEQAKNFRPPILSLLVQRSNNFDLQTRAVLRWGNSPQT